MLKHEAIKLHAAALNSAQATLNEFDIGTVQRDTAEVIGFGSGTKSCKKLLV